MKRRQFIKTVSLSGIAIATIPQWAFIQNLISTEELIGKGNPQLFGDTYKLQEEAHLAFLKMKKEAAMKMKMESAAKMKKESAMKAAKPDYPDIDGDGNTTESMKQAASDKKSGVKMTFENLTKKFSSATESFLDENPMAMKAAAAIVTAAKLKKKGKKNIYLRI